MQEGVDSTWKTRTVSYDKTKSSGWPWILRHLLAEQRAADAVQSVTATFQGVMTDVPVQTATVQAVGAVSPTMIDVWGQIAPVQTATFQAVGPVSPTMTDDWWETVPFDGAVSSTMLVASEEEDCDLAELLALLVGAED